MFKGLNHIEVSTDLAAECSLKQSLDVKSNLLDAVASPLSRHFNFSEVEVVVVKDHLTRVKGHSLFEESVL